MQFLRSTLRFVSGVIAVCVVGALGIAGLVWLEEISSPHQRGNGCCSESGAIATLKNIADAQQQFRSMTALDRDGDGVGEFGSLHELGGFAALPAGLPQDGRFLAGAPLTQPLVSAPFGAPIGSLVIRHGYRFELFLPAKDGTWIRALPAVFGTTRVDADRAEHEFRFYAWPNDYGGHTRRAFVVDQTGQVYGTRNRDRNYSGRLSPAPEAAGDPSDPDQLVDNGRALDEQVWTRAN